MSPGGIRRRNNPIDEVNFCRGKGLDKRVCPQLAGDNCPPGGFERRLMKFIDFLCFGNYSLSPVAVTRYLSPSFLSSFLSFFREKQRRLFAIARDDKKKIVESK